MNETNAKMNKAADVMLQKAEHCFDLARTEHDGAERQHENAARMHRSAEKQNAGADKLMRLAQALESDAINLKGEAPVNAGPPITRAG
jgi:hypothetical protein